VCGETIDFDRGGEKRKLVKVFFFNERKSQAHKLDHGSIRPVTDFRIIIDAVISPSRLFSAIGRVWRCNTLEARGFRIATELDNFMQ
jgi:hypothetical protein